VRLGEAGGEGADVRVGARATKGTLRRLVGDNEPHLRAGAGEDQLEVRRTGEAGN
jgi:hypothetical protein